LKEAWFNPPWCRRLPHRWRAPFPSRWVWSMWRRPGSFSRSIRRCATEIGIGSCWGSAATPRNREWSGNWAAASARWTQHPALYRRLVVWVLVRRPIRQIHTAIHRRHSRFIRVPVFCIEHWPARCDDGLMAPGLPSNWVWKGTPLVAHIASLM